MPKVTVLMPAYNVGKYIKESIESVLNQTFTDFTLLVVDDCSTDNTADVVNSFLDSRIRYEKNEHNLGLAENLNRGIELAETEFIARMDGDDIAEQNWLAEEYAILSTHPEIDVCGAGFQFFGTRSSIVIYPSSHEDIKVQMLFGCPVIVPMFRKKSIVDNGFRYKTSAFPAEDYTMWVECIQKLKFYNIQKILFHYRMHETQISTSKCIAQQTKSNEARLVLLNRLYQDFNNDQKQFFLEIFVGHNISNCQDLSNMKQFAKLLISKNAITNYFNPHSLKNKFRLHIATSAYYLSIDQYFRNGYSLRQYLIYIKSGCIKYVPAKYTFKMLVKSVLGTKK